MFDPLVFLLTQLGLVLVTATLLGQLAQRLRLPVVVGHLLAGVLLGPTLIGRIRGATALFPVGDPINQIRTSFLTVGLLLFLLLVGLEIDFDAARHRLRTILPTSAVGMILPFSVGFVAVLVFPALWGAAGDTQLVSLAFVVGVSLSISALPVIARTLTDLGLIRTDIGQVILSAAVLDDIAGWIGFATVIALFAPSSNASPAPWQVLLIILSGFAITLTVGRRVGSRLGKWLTAYPQYSGLGLGVILAVTLLAAASMELLGVHAFFGALMVGVAFSPVSERIFEPVVQVVRYFFSPLYFGAVGLAVDFASGFDPTLVVTVLVIACAGKLIGAGLGARLGGYGVRQSMAIASGMNARGAVEILLAGIALSNHIINEQLFVALVIMALATSIMGGWLIQRLLDIRPPRVLVKALVPVLQRLDPFGRPVEEIEIGERLTIGRHPANRLALITDPLVSLEHALVKRLNGHFHVEDLGSTNGTQLWQDRNWRDVSITELRDGDILVVGANVFRFSTGAAAAGAGEV
jgi:Kef-type K+ transport system membrane component KefB